MYNVQCEAFAKGCIVKNQKWSLSTSPNDNFSDTFFDQMSQVYGVPGPSRGDKQTDPRTLQPIDWPD